MVFLPSSYYFGWLTFQSLFELIVLLINLLPSFFLLIFLFNFIAMTTKFPTFSQALAQDPTTRRLWFGIATAHDFESHDGITEDRLYQR